MSDIDDFEDERVVDARKEFADYADYRSACNRNGETPLDQAAWFALKYPFGVLPPARAELWDTYEYYCNNRRHFNEPPLEEVRWTALHDAFVAKQPKS